MEYLVDETVLLDNSEYTTMHDAIKLKKSHTEVEKAFDFYKAKHILRIKRELERNLENFLGKQKIDLNSSCHFLKPC